MIQLLSTLKQRDVQVSQAFLTGVKEVTRHSRTESALVVREVTVATIAANFKSP